MSDQERLRGYVDVWWQAVDAFTRLLETVPGDQWATPTDRPGWDVHAVAAHTAHLEAVMAGAEHDQVDIGEPAHVSGIMGAFTEQGVVARRDRTPDGLISEIRESTTKRHTHLLANPPTDPGALDSAPAQHTADYLLESMGLVLGKRVKPSPGTTVVIDVDGSAPVALTVTDEGRATPLGDVPTDPTAALAMSREDFVVAAGGRRTPSDVRVSGDSDLAARLLGAMAVTP